MKTASFFLTLSLLAGRAFAQSVTDSEAFWGGTLPLTVLERQAVLTGQVNQAADQVTLQQRGSGNQARYQNTGGGQGNRATLTQEGDDNRLSLSVNGSRNEYLLEQRGNANDLQLNGLRGDNLNLSVRQAGNHNGLTLSSDALEGVGGAVGPIRIEQSGGMRVTVTSSYFTQQ